MAAIETNTKISMHIRSNSFPSAPHPVLSQFEGHLNRLKSSEAASSSSSISHKLGGLQDLYDCTDTVLQLSTIKQALAQECNEKSVDKLLEGSLVLLDICCTAKDCLLQSKETIQGLHSVLRRRGSETSGFTIESGKYLASRKKMKKEIKKALANLKGTLKDSSTNEQNEALSMLSILKEAEAVAVNSLESLLLFVSDSKRHLKQRRWSVISKLMQPKKITCVSEQSDINEFEEVDAALESLISHKHSSVQNLQTHLGNLELCIQDLEEGIESLSRQLIRTRVFLLNIFNQ
ncbi:uncharacterized protein LOC114723700 [Neltuma alba]|uniref:uncharacterized protein LOC114723686 n=1 Tax=Neltuma alba TaxID=207710 RepID=UPI0010A343F7|nr:uncharacterized protein LOC114723686 [Prosopis alba]XP_028765759.1 uncharacterized protein LOC114723700 [Prosopis alba]